MAGEGRPNIVWINCEDLDETLGCYGDSYAVTPHLDALAGEGLLYRNAFANAPICAPARNCLITGMYPTSLGGQHLRCEIELPPEVVPFPVLMREQGGYFTTNHGKTDTNFNPDGIYDYWKNDLAPWRARKDSDRPFFSFFVLGTTHEGRGNMRDRYEQAVAELSPEKFHDPAQAQLPPYFPDTPKMRELWARYYDLVSAMDEEVGEILANLKADGLWENTIVFFFSDHGHGLPRHKRWLLDSGLRVPLIIRIPERFQGLAGGVAPGSKVDGLVSFVDFAPTVLNLAGLEIPTVTQGRPFLGKNRGQSRQYVYGARDRADDMFEVSRAVHDGRFIYVRHFLDRLPYLQGGRIFGNQKESLAELRRARDAGELDQHSSKLFLEKKPVEELFDLESDPWELNNLAGDPLHSNRLKLMRTEMKRWILDHRDIGFLPESDYSRRARDAGTSIYQIAQDPEFYDLPNVLAAAMGELVTDRRDDGVVYWQIQREEVGDLASLISHLNPSIAVAAAELACLTGHSNIGLPVLEESIGSEDLRLALEAARAMFQIGEVAEPAVTRIEEVRRGLEGPKGGRRRYRDFNYASFTGWALEGALINCGVAKAEDFE